MKKTRKPESEGRNKENKASKKLTTVMPKEDFDNDDQNKFGGIPDREFKKNLGCG